MLAIQTYTATNTKHHKQEGRNKGLTEFELTPTEHSLCTRQCSRPFTHIDSFDPHKNLMN